MMADLSDTYLDPARLHVVSDVLGELTKCLQPTPEAMHRYDLVLECLGDEIVLRCDPLSLVVKLNKDAQKLTLTWFEMAEFVMVSPHEDGAYVEMRGDGKRGGVGFFGSERKRERLPFALILRPGSLSSGGLYNSNLWYRIHTPCIRAAVPEAPVQLRVPRTYTHQDPLQLRVPGFTLAWKGIDVASPRIPLHTLTLQ